MSLYAMDDASQFLRHALLHAATDEDRIAVHDELARAAEQSGRWADMERSCDAILALPAIASAPKRALPVELRRLVARSRMGQGTRETEAECRELLAVAERVGSVADVVQTRSLLVQTLQRLGEVDEAIRIAEHSLRLAEADEDRGLAVEAMDRLALTQLASRPLDAVELTLRLVALSHDRGDLRMEARAFLTMGVARMQMLDIAGGREAFSSALAIARDAQAIDVAAMASANLGVVCLRAGDYDAAHSALHDALRLNTTLRNNANRLAALYNIATLAAERGDLVEAVRLYKETAALATRLETDDIAVGAHAGAGLAALRLGETADADAALHAAETQLGARRDWWFQGRQLLESLVIRLHAQAGQHQQALERFRTAVERLEVTDIHAATWLVADSAGMVAEHDPTVWETVQRLSQHETVQLFAPLSAQFTALRDMLERMPAVRFENSRKG
jgi:tetratricopeptide (TPR) repeat protein